MKDPLNDLAALRNGTFDVFLCHNDGDKAEVKAIGRVLTSNGIRPWLDEWNLRPGLPWQETLEEEIGRVKSAAVFVGKNGTGPWQRREIRAFLEEFVSRGCPVIPVLLKDAPTKPELPIFLKSMTWVDFRKVDPDPMGRLIWGITGNKDPPTISSQALNANYRLTDLVGLRHIARRYGLVEHISDAATVSLLHYPTAVSITQKKKIVVRQGQLSLAGNEEAAIQFLGDIRAFGFFYQQGMYYVSLEITMSDGNKLEVSGGEFFPETNFSWLSLANTNSIGSYLYRSERWFVHSLVILLLFNERSPKTILLKGQKRQRRAMQ